MELNIGSQTLYGPNATARMSDGDNLSIAYTDAKGDTYIVNISARAIALSIREQRTGDQLFIQRQPYGNVFMGG